MKTIYHEKQYLDEDGLDKLWDKIKKYVKENAVEGGSVDLDQFVTDAELEKALSDIFNRPSESVPPTADVVQDGKDGFSPTISVTEKDYGYLLSITDKNGSYEVAVRNGIDGENGLDGFSPTAMVEQTEDGATISITDKNGTTTAKISNGKDGANISDSGNGESMGSHDVILRTYNKEEILPEKYFDGKDIYMKWYHVDALDTAPSAQVYYDFFHIETETDIDRLIACDAEWTKQTSTYHTVFSGNSAEITEPIGTASSVSNLANKANQAITQRVLWCSATKYDSGTSKDRFQIMVARGQAMYNYSVDICVKYTKK